MKKTLDDGRTYCCLCFEYFPLEKLHKVSEDIWEDVCLDCWNNEQAMLKGWVHE